MNVPELSKLLLLYVHFIVETLLGSKKERSKLATANLRDKHLNSSFQKQNLSSPLVHTGK
jgi:hypothetical protein